MDEYIAEHKEGDVVTGRVADVSRGRARVELGQGIDAVCELKNGDTGEAGQAAGKPDLSSLTSMLAAKWKSGESSAARREPARAGQVRSFRIVRLDPGSKQIEVELAS